MLQVNYFPPVREDSVLDIANHIFPNSIDLAARRLYILKQRFKSLEDDVTILRTQLDRLVKNG